MYGLEGNVGIKIPPLVHMNSGRKDLILLNSLYGVLLVLDGLFKSVVADIL